MSRSYVSVELRRIVTARAEQLCEYCLIHEDETFFGCEVDHVVSEKHGGPTEESNLALACLFCNRNKGSDIGSVAPRTGLLVPFFNPRKDTWAEHFRLAVDGMRIEPLTDIGEATVRILGINAADRLLERDALHAVGSYPTPSAARRSAGAQSDQPQADT